MKYLQQQGIHTVANINMRVYPIINKYITKKETGINPLTTDDAYMHHDPCELSISLWEFIWSIKY